MPREPPRGRHPRPESFTSDSLDYQDDYPYGPPGPPYHPGAATGWGHVPHSGYAPEPSVISDQFHPRDVMAYRNYQDPYIDDNPFAPRGPVDDYGYPPRQLPHRSRPPPHHRYSMGGPMPGPMAGPPPGALMRYPPQHHYYDPYSGGYFPQIPQQEPYQRHSPEKEKPTTPPASSVSPNDERFAKLEEMIMMQTQLEQAKQMAKAKAKQEEEHKKKLADEKTQTEKLIALEALIQKQNEAAIAREKAMEAKAKEAEATAIAKMQREAAEKAATEKIGKELSAAAADAKKAAEAEAEKKAKEAKDAADKAFEEMKKKHEEAEAAKKKAEEEAAALKPKGVPPPIKFKDAVGRKFSFPFDICKTWKVSPRFPDLKYPIC